MTEPLKLWSVTTLLKLGMGTSDPLVNWAVRATNTYALENMDVLGPLYNRDPEAAIKTVGQSRYQKTGKAMARGTELHKAAESLALGVVPEAIDVDAVPYFEQYKRFLEEHSPRFEMATEAARLLSLAFLRRHAGRHHGARRATPRLRHQDDRQGA